MDKWFHDFDVLCISETWLSEHVKDNDISIPGYNIFRKDRKHSLGGGVCIYVKENFIVKIREDLMFDEVEAVRVDINIGSTCYLVCCIYRPPSSTVAYFDKMVDMFEKATLENPHVIALGDLNFDYKLDDSLCNNPIYYLEMSYGLRQLITEKTRVSHQSESTIDVILTSHPDMHKKSGIIKYTLSDHFLTYTEVQRHCPSKDTHKHNTVRFRDMKCFDQDKFLDDIKSNSCFSDNSFQRTPSWNEWKSTFYTEWSMIGLKTLMRVNWRVHAYWIYLSVLIPLIMTSF